MGCTNVPNDRDDELLKQAREGKFSQPDPEMLKEVMPEIREVIEKKMKEIRRLEQPRRERVMRLIESGKEINKVSPEGIGKDIKVYKVIGTYPVEIKNFSNSWLKSNDEVASLLEKLPQIGHLAYEEIKYTGTLETVLNEEGKIGAIAGEATPEESGRASIRINEHHPDILLSESESEQLNPQQIEQKMKVKEMETICHEYAEGVWRELTILEGERSQWRSLYWNTHVEKGRYVSECASKTAREDFCECSAWFFIAPEKLKNIDETKYNFLKDFYSSLENESRYLEKELSKNKGGGKK